MPVLEHFGYCAARQLIEVVERVACLVERVGLCHSKVVGQPQQLDSPRELGVHFRPRLDVEQVGYLS
jgi:hypothetical protein